MGNDNPNSTTPERAGDAARTAWTCLECDYSLAHTSEDRCPECGAAFSPSEMSTLFSNVPTPSYPWDTHKGMREWIAMMRMMVLGPNDELQRRMSCVPDGDAAIAFAFINYTLIPILIGVEATCLAIAAGVRGEAPGFELCFGAALSVAWASLMFFYELMLSTVLSSGLTPKRQRPGWAPWAVLVHYPSAYPTMIVVLNLIGGVLALIASVIAMLISVLLRIDIYPYLALPSAALVILPSMILWPTWALQIASSAIVVSRPSAMRGVFLVVLILLLAVGSLMQGLCVASLTVFTTGRLLARGEAGIP